MRDPIYILLWLAAFTAISCASDDRAEDVFVNQNDDENQASNSAPGQVSSSPFEHPTAIGLEASVTPQEALNRIREVGPPEFTSRMHSCRKMRYRTIGRVLASRGVNLATTGEVQAGRMYREAGQALGAPNYEGRISEGTELTVASSSRLFDILVQAAPEIIAQIGSRPECQIDGSPAALFDAEGRCDADGLTCLLGVPASSAHVGLCNDIVRQANASGGNNAEEGKSIAVATLLASQFTCE